MSTIAHSRCTKPPGVLLKSYLPVPAPWPGTLGARSVGASSKLTAFSGGLGGREICPIPLCAGRLKASCARHLIRVSGS